MIYPSDITFSSNHRIQNNNKTQRHDEIANPYGENTVYSYLLLFLVGCIRILAHIRLQCNIQLINIHRYCWICDSERNL